MIDSVGSDSLVKNIEKYLPFKLQAHHAPQTIARGLIPLNPLLKSKELLNPLKTN